MWSQDNAGSGVAPGSGAARKEIGSSCLNFFQTDGKAPGGQEFSEPVCEGRLSTLIRAGIPIGVDRWNADKFLQ